MRRRALWVMALLVAAPGCAAVLHGTVGYVGTMDGVPAHGVSAEGHLALSINPHPIDTWGQPRGHFQGPGLGARMRGGPGLFHMSLGPEVLQVWRGSVAPWLRVGTSLVQLESYQGSFAWGIFSPWVQGGIAFCDNLAYTQRCVTVGVSAEYVLRFTEEPSGFLYTVNLGYLSLSGR